MPFDPDQPFTVIGPAPALNQAQSTIAQPNNFNMTFGPGGMTATQQQLPSDLQRYNALVQSGQFKGTPADLLQEDARRREAGTKTGIAQAQDIEREQASQRFAPLLGAQPPAFTKDNRLSESPANAYGYDATWNSVARGFQGVFGNKPSDYQKNISADETAIQNLHNRLLSALSVRPDGSQRESNYTLRLSQDVLPKVGSLFTSPAEAADKYGPLLSEIGSQITEAQDHAKALISANKYNDIAPVATRIERLTRDQNEVFTLKKYLENNLAGKPGSAGTGRVKINLKGNILQ